MHLVPGAGNGRLHLAPWGLGADPSKTFQVIPFGSSQMQESRLGSAARSPLGVNTRVPRTADRGQGLGAARAVNPERSCPRAVPGKAFQPPKPH